MMSNEEYLPMEDEIEVKRQAYFKHQWKLKHIPLYRQFNKWRSVRQVKKLTHTKFPQSSKEESK